MFGQICKKKSEFCILPGITQYLRE